MPRRVDVYVGRRLRQRRIAVGLTQAELAEQIGVRFQQVQKYETGVNRISASRLWDVAKALKVPVSYFFDGIEPSRQAAQGEFRDVLEERESIELVRAYYQIPEIQRERFIGLMRVMSSDFGDRSGDASVHAA